MEENKDLLRITKETEGMSIHWNVSDANEMMGIAIAITTCTKQNEDFLFMLLGTIKEAFSNNKFAKVLDDNCIEVPDFDSILKNNK